MSEEKYYLATPNESFRLDAMPVNRAAAEERLNQLNSLPPGLYCFWKTNDSDPYPIEQSVFEFERDNETFYLKQTLEYDKDNVRVSDIQFYADKLKKNIGSETISNVVLQGYSEGDNEFDSEMMVLIYGDNATKELAIIFIDIGEGVQINIKSPQSEADILHCYIECYSVHCALSTVEVLVEFLTGSTTVMLSTQSNSEVIW